MRSWNNIMNIGLLAYNFVNSWCFSYSVFVMLMFLVHWYGEKKHVPNILAHCLVNSHHFTQIFHLCCLIHIGWVQIHSIYEALGKKNTQITYSSTFEILKRASDGNFTFSHEIIWRRTYFNNKWEVHHQMQFKVIHII